jgi:hypothetical protein
MAEPLRERTDAERRGGVCLRTRRVTSFALSQAELDRYREEGFLGPYRLCSEEEMAVHRARLEAAIPDLRIKGRQAALVGPRATVHNRHLDVPAIWALVNRPELVDRAVSLLGPDLQLYRTNLFVKRPGSKPVPWHQDANWRWPVEPPRLVSAWIAFDATTIENGCTQFIRHSQHEMLPHVRAPQEVHFDEMAEPALVDTEGAIPAELRAGEFMLFSYQTLHGSGPNVSSGRRMGMSARIIGSDVRVTRYDSPEHGVFQLAGIDRTGLNRVLAPPSDPDFPGKETQ